MCVYSKYWRTKGNVCVYFTRKPDFHLCVSGDGMNAYMAYKVTTKVSYQNVPSSAQRATQQTGNQNSTLKHPCSFFFVSLFLSLCVSRPDLHDSV